MKAVFTVKNRPKHCLGEMSDNQFMLPDRVSYATDIAADLEKRREGEARDFSALTDILSVLTRLVGPSCRACEFSLRSEANRCSMKETCK